MMTRAWKTNEVRILREMYATHTAEEIGALIGRSVRAVCNRANREGLSKPHEFFAICTRKRWA